MTRDDTHSDAHSDNRTGHAGQRRMRGRARPASRRIATPIPPDLFSFETVDPVPEDAPRWDESYWQGGEEHARRLLELTDLLATEKAHGDPSKDLEVLYDVRDRVLMAQAVWNAVTRAQGDLAKIDRGPLAGILVEQAGMAEEDVELVLEVLLERRVRRWPDDRTLIAAWRVAPGADGTPRVDVHVA